METINWFEYSEDRSDVGNAMKFIEDLPGKFKMFVDPRNSTFKDHLNKFENLGVNSALFDEALNEAFGEYNLSFLKINRSLKLDKIERTNIRNEKFAKNLLNCGLTGSSLKLKANTLKLLWDSVIAKVEQLGQGIIDFANNELVKLLRKFFTYLNSILGSFSKVFSGIEVIKEIKEIIEAYLSIADKD